jgi:subtilase family serine protease
VSSVFAKPAWQTGLGVPADGMRDVPDVSLSAASHDGYLVYSSDNATSASTMYVFGGTSASAPSFAGIMALINQKTGARQGNANPRFYQLSAAQASGGPAPFHLITSGNNSVPGLTGYAASAATPYYNQASGLGSVDGSVLINNWSATQANSSTAMTANPANASFGQSVSLSATVTGNSPTGTVQFKDGTTNIGSPATLSGGTASLNTGALAVGSHTITAVYSGDTANSSSVSPGVSVTVAKAPSAISLASTSASTTLGQSVTFTATVSGNLLAGTVQFMDGSTSLGIFAINACTASLTTTALGVGTHNITAIYSGDANNQGSTSTVLTETVLPVVTASSTVLSTTTNSLPAGQSVTLTATVTGSAPTGTVQFKDGAANMGGPVAVSGNQTILSINSLTVGSHIITAVYSGDIANSASTSSSVVINVTTVASSLALSSSKPTTAPGESVTFTATVSGLSPSGSVQFLDGGSSLGSATIIAGKAAYSTSALSAGAHSIMASYAGDANNGASVSMAVIQTVTGSGTGGTTDSGDVPTLPEWAALVMALLLVATVRRHAQASMNGSSRFRKRQL